jgi:hypothetical protein
VDTTYAVMNFALLFFVLPVSLIHLLIEVGRKLNGQ